MAHNRMGDDTRFFNETGLSMVTKNNQYGQFTGYAYCEEEDKDIKNQWDGMRIAEFYCDRKIQKAKAMDMASRAKGIQHAYNVLSNTYGKDDDIVLALGRQLYAAKRIAEKEGKKYQDMKNGGRDFVENIVKSRRKFRETYPAHIEE